jgi:hypothetical protein
MREKMRWDTLSYNSRIRITTYSSFLGGGHYRVRIMVGPRNEDGTDNLGPRSRPYRVIEDITASSHDHVFEQCAAMIRKDPNWKGIK